LARQKFLLAYCLRNVTELSSYSRDEGYDLGEGYLCFEKDATGPEIKLIVIGSAASLAAIFISAAKRRIFRFTCLTGMV
jgi:hypothetical protein